MIREGAAGFLPKDAAFDEMLAALRELMAGRQYLTTIARDVVREFIAQKPGPKSAAYTDLTARGKKSLG